MPRSRLSGKIGAALDPCAAIQVAFELADGQEREIVFRLGARRNADATHAAWCSASADPPPRADALDAVRQYWTAHARRRAGRNARCRRSTCWPTAGSLYQTLACRLWARSGYYQSGGAFGFRDQLQDVMALVHAEPRLLREHLLLCAGRQFREGDVQHWWHPPSGRGVRTHCSDDYLWLPLATCRYVLSDRRHRRARRNRPASSTAAR